MGKLSLDQIVFRWTVSIGSLILVWMIFTTLTILSDMTRRDALAMGTILASAFYFFFGWPYFFKNVPANRGWIISNPWIREKDAIVVSGPVVQMTLTANHQLISKIRGVNTDFTGYRHTRAQWEAQAGIMPTLPWEKAIAEIDMRKIILVKGEKETYTLADKSTIVIEWQIQVSPLPGFIANFNKMHEEDIRKLVKIRAQKFLQGFIGSLSSVGFGSAQQEAIKQGFELLFGGEGFIDVEEQEMGIWTSTPRIIDIDQPKKVQDARNTQDELAFITQSAVDTWNSFEQKISPESALQHAGRAYIVSKGGDLSLVDFGGVFGGGKKSRNRN